MSNKVIMVPCQIYYVVSDSWTGHAVYLCRSADEAAHHQYLEMLDAHGYTVTDDQDEIRPEQFRAWPADKWPHDLSFSQAFDWIGQQNER